ncbi:MAG: 6-phosphogluconolactonase [Hyphomonadaceae bacterium]|nr:6-phosphogluconolactonase [Hyphomonadaceae bacterium]
MNAVALHIAEALKTGISERGAACAALSGGSTPEPAYRLLAAMPLDWPRVTFALVDERFVPPTDPASNEALLRRSLARATSGGATLLPMYEASTPEGAASRANTPYAGQTIDLALMGMGADGHTASWFPQSPDLGAALHDARTVIAVTAKGAAGSSERLTLTRSALAQAKRIALLITGAEKRALLEDRSRQPLPVDDLLALPRGVETFWAA